MDKLGVEELACLLQNHMPVEIVNMLKGNFTVCPLSLLCSSLWCLSLLVFSNPLFGTVAQHVTGEDFESLTVEDLKTFQFPLGYIKTINRVKLLLSEVSVF